MTRLIILPGWGGNKETWDEFTKLASNDFKVEVIELPCFGDEPCPDTVWGVEEYSNFVKEKLSNVKGQRSDVYLLGHSFGGQVATHLVANNSQICDKLILSGPAVFRPKKRIRRAILGTISKIGKVIFRLPMIESFNGEIEKLYRRVSRTADYADTSGIKRDIFIKIIRQDLREEAKKINIPTLIIWGTKDTYVPVRDAYKLNKLIRNSKLEIIKGGKHGLHIQQPKNLLNIIKRF